MTYKIITLVLIGIFISAVIQANPVYTPGVWKNIGTPADFNLSGTFGVTSVEIDPGNPSILYVSVDQRGIWKTTNGGSTWSPLGTPGESCDYKDTTRYLDSPVRVKVDPNNPGHMYCTQGVRGCTQGFWVTNDGGATWVRPKSYRDAVTSVNGACDNTHMDVDPTDFNHFLLAFHYYWGEGASGIFESRDGGSTWKIHYPGGMCCPSKGVSFLYNPERGIGNAHTWMVSNDNTDIWRTEDGGTTLTKVSDVPPPHGGISGVYYAKNGTIYSGGGSCPIRSTDNGKTWQDITGLPIGAYFMVYGDGNLLYAHLATTGDIGYQAPWYVSPETDGTHWTEYKVGAQAQTMSTGPSFMAFDKVNRIMYSANWTGGLYALKVDTGTVTIAPDSHSDYINNVKHFTPARIVKISGGRFMVPENVAPGAGSTQVFDIKGNLIGLVSVSTDGRMTGTMKKIGMQMVVARTKAVNTEHNPGKGE